MPCDCANNFFLQIFCSDFLIFYSFVKTVTMAREMLFTALRLAQWGKFCTNHLWPNWAIFERSWYNFYSISPNIWQLLELIYKTVNSLLWLLPISANLSKIGLLLIIPTFTLVGGQLAEQSLLIQRTRVQIQSWILTLTYCWL